MRLRTGGRSSRADSVLGPVKRVEREGISMSFFLKKGAARARSSSGRPWITAAIKPVVESLEGRMLLSTVEPDSILSALESHTLSPEQMDLLGVSEVEWNGGNVASSGKRGL